MKKYLGLVKKETESANGLNIRLLTKFSNHKKEIKEWMKLYPNDKKMILENTPKLNKFFKVFEDYKPVTDKEKARAIKLYQNLISKED